MSKKNEIVACLAEEYARPISRLGDSFFDGLTEIRIRANRPLNLYHKGQERYICRNGNLNPTSCEAIYGHTEGIAKTLELVCNHSPYAYENELSCGYITIRGGHRVGIAGRSIREGEKIKTLRNISAINLRISHQLLGCADSVISHIFSGDHPMHTLIISPPGCGKTTILRDIVRQISNGIPAIAKGRSVSVVDERSEIAGCYQGIPQNDVGPRTDVLDACPKAEGMLMLLRSMSPKVIAVDEIGRMDDAIAIEEVTNAGVAVVCTIHGKNLEEVRHKPTMRQLIEQRIFKRFIVLENLGKITGIFDEYGDCIC